MNSPRILKIACLPVAGDENPYQQLMIEGLNQSRNLHALPGCNDRFLGILRTAFMHRPDYIHFDWIVSYYYRRWNVLTYLSVLMFCMQIVILHRLSSIQIVWTLHNLHPHDVPDKELHRFCQRFLARRCLWLRVFSKNSVQRAAQELRVNEGLFRIIPEGDYQSVYLDFCTTEEARKKLGLLPQARLLLFLGRIKPYKGISELIHAFNELRDPMTFLLLAGQITDKSYEEHILQQCSSSIMLHNRFIPPSELHYYFNAADAVVLPFREIENSGSLVMAMGFSKPVVAPAKGVIPQRLAHQHELLYDTPEALPSVLIKVLNYSSQQRSSIGKMNSDSLKKYRWEDFATAFHRY